MPMRIRLATQDDAPAIVGLLLEDATERRALDTPLWPIAADARERAGATVATEAKGEGTVRWLLADVGHAIVGVSRAGTIPCPPIYQNAGQPTSFLFEETFVARHAPGDTWPLLIAEAERTTSSLGASVFLAACAPAQREKRRALEAAGYGIVTNYLVKHGLMGHPPPSVRSASADDVPSIVTLTTQSLASLQEANPKMWTPHPEAAPRFATWMNYSLTLPDRRIFVAEDRRGFIIAQSPGAFHVPQTSPRDHLGLVDDFWSEDFTAPSPPRYSDRTMDLLSAAELEFVNRGRTTTMVICPAARQPKQDFLRASGYRDGNAWMLKA